MMEEKEIDLLDLLADVLSHWRGVLVWMIIGALVFGAVDYMMSVNVIKEVEEQAAEDFPGEEITTELIAESIVARELQEAQRTAVLITIDDEEELEKRKKYGDVSIVLDMDPYKIPRVELVYELALISPQENHMVANVYQDVLSGSGLFVYIQEKTGIDATAARELISISARTNKDYLDEYQKLIVGKDSMKISVMHVDEATCKQLAETVKDYLNQVYEEITDSIGEHEIVLISENAGLVMDMDVLDKQVNYRNSLLTLENTIAKAYDGFTDEQILYYNLLTGKEEVEVNTKADLSLKMVVIGAIVFAFLYAGIWMVLYVINGKLRACDNLNSIYGIATLGVVTAAGKKKKKFMDATIEKIRNTGRRVPSFEDSMELATTAAKLEVTNKEIAEVCILGCDLEAASQVCEKLTASLEKDNIKVTKLNNILGDAAAMDSIQSVKTAILVEKAGSSSYRDIEEEIKLLKRQDITILGGIIVE